MKSVIKTMTESTEDGPGALPFFHGALMDEDADMLLKKEGDFLLQLKKSRLMLAIRGAKAIRRVEVKKNEIGQMRVSSGKWFDSVRELVDYYKEYSLPLEAEKLKLRNAVPRGKYQMYHSDVKVIKKIGSGAYGTVFRGRLKRTGETIAIKKIDTEGTAAADDALKEMMKEARVMQLYDHRNIVRFYGFIVDRMPYLLVMEYCDGGSVEDKLRSKGKKLVISVRIDWAAQAAAGLEYLHSKECIHRDMAARNCLLDRGVVKLADFGMCRPAAVYKVDLSKPLNVRWLAPEVWKNAETRYNTDIFAFGVMIWELFEIPYQTPYEGMKALDVKNRTQEGFRLQPSEYMPEAVAEIMEKAWHHEPKKRPDASKLRRMLDEINAGAAEKN